MDIDPLESIFCNSYLSDLVSIQPISTDENQKVSYLKFKTNAEKCQVDLVVEELHVEIDKVMKIQHLDPSEIIAKLERQIATVLLYSTGTISTWDAKECSGKTLKELFERVYIQLIQILGIIHRKTLKSNANKIIVVSSDIAKLFKMFATTCGSGCHQNKYLGCYFCAWKIYEEPYFPNGTILCGYKGKFNGDAGYILATSHMNNSFLYYTDKLVDNKHYARLNIENFKSVMDSMQPQDKG